MIVGFLKLKSASSAARATAWRGRSSSPLFTITLPPEPLSKSSLVRIRQSPRARRLSQRPHQSECEQQRDRDFNKLPPVVNLKDRSNTADHWKTNGLSGRQRRGQYKRPPGVMVEGRNAVAHFDGHPPMRIQKEQRAYQ